MSEPLDLDELEAHVKHDSRGGVMCSMYAATALALIAELREARRVLAYVEEQLDEFDVAGGDFNYGPLRDIGDAVHGSGTYFTTLEHIDDLELQLAEARKDTERLRETLDSMPCACHGLQALSPTEHQPSCPRAIADAARTAGQKENE